MFMCQTMVTEIQGQESAVYSYKGNLLLFAKIITENQAKEFAEFMTEELDNWKTLLSQFLMNWV